MAPTPSPSENDPSREPRDPTPMNDMTTPRPIPAAPPELTLWDWLTKSASAEQWLLPITGAWILGLDWLLFTQNTLVLGLATPLLVVAGFVGGTLGTHYFQTRYAGDRGPSAWIKSILAGIVVGIPFPLAGTFVGGWILFNSGLHSIRDRLLRRK